MKLLSLTKRAHDLLQITKLYTVFETFENEDSAIASFSADPPTELELRWTRFFKLIANHAFRGRRSESSEGAGSEPEAELKQDHIQLRLSQSRACKT